MTTFFLLRHGETDAVARRVLSGRTPGVSLNDLGRRQAEALAGWLDAEPIATIYSSPLERTRETAAPIAERLGLSVNVADELLEIDFGAWTGRAFDDLGHDPAWRRFNSFRSGSPPPGGELMAAAQLRIVGFLLRLRAELPGESVAIVSHADVIKAAIAYFLGVSLDLFGRIEIGPGSASALALDEDGPRVLYVNRVPAGA